MDFLFDGGCNFNFRDFDGLIVVRSILCPWNFTQERKNVVYLGLLSRFLLTRFVIFL